jgi:hypothetical protein
LEVIAVHSLTCRISVRGCGTASYRRRKQDATNLDRSAGQGCKRGKLPL